MKNRLIILLLIFSIKTFGQITNNGFELTDEFNESQQGWFIVETKDFNVSLTNGMYSINHKKKKGESFIGKQFEIVNWRDDFIIETRFKFISHGKKNSYFGLGMQDNSYQYSYCINPSKQYFLKSSANSSQIIINENCPFDFDPNKEISLKLVHIKNNLDLYINNLLVKSINYQKFIGNKIGFVAFGELQVNVDYLIVSYTPRAINLVKNPINGYEKINLGNGVNSKFNEFAPRISSDGNTLYFVRNNDPEIISKWGAENQDIYYSTLDENGVWPVARNIGFPLNNNEGNFVISISPDQNSILLGNKYTETGEPNGGALSISTMEQTGDWGMPKDITIKNFVNTNNYVSYSLSPDQNVLICAIETDESIGDLDLYVCFLNKDNTWTKPKHMGEILNTFDLEFSPFIASDAKTLYFSSKGHPGYGNADIYIAKRLDDTWLNWSEPKNLGSEINTKNWDGYFTIPASGDIAYLSSSDNSLGGIDIFKIKLTEDARPDPVALIKGRVINVKTEDPLNAKIRYKILKTDQEVGVATSSGVDGKYQISLKGGEKYSFLAEKDGFYSISDNIDLSELTEYKEIERDLSLAPIAKGEVIRLNNLFFIFDTDQILEESIGELKQLHSTLTNNSSLKIEISGHTDNKGSDVYNLDLSMRRATAIVKYLIENGVDAQRLQAKGYGETKPIASNETEEGRQINRRVEFTILEK